MNTTVNFEELHRIVLNRLKADDYALCRNNAPYKESDLDLYEAIAVGAAEAARIMIQEYHKMVYDTK